MSSKPQTPNDEFITTREASRLLGVGLSTVQGWVEAGILPAWKTAGGHRRIPVASIEELRRKQLAVLDAAQKPENITVLVVEDDPVQRLVYEDQITRMKDDLGGEINLVMATNGFEGLLLTGQRMPNLIITDLMMPGMDGYHLIQELHAKLKHTVAIVVVTMLSQDEVMARGTIPKGIKVLSKPVPYATLLEVIGSHIGRSAIPSREKP
jgi:excisionase family DNA binding protein